MHIVVRLPVALRIKHPQCSLDVLRLSFSSVLLATFPSVLHAAGLLFGGLISPHVFANFLVMSTSLSR